MGPSYSNHLENVMEGAMGDFGAGVGAAVSIVIVLLVGAFLYECGRQLWYWSAAKLFGWSENEKFMRETAWVDRAAA
jgi:hypothetical protein